MLNFFSHTYSSNFSFFSGQPEVHSPGPSDPANTLNNQSTRTSLFGGSKVTSLFNHQFYLLFLLRSLKPLLRTSLTLSKHATTNFFTAQNPIQGDV